MQVNKRLPDVLIGILIVILTIGLGSLLLTQRNQVAQQPVTPPPVVNIPDAPDNTTSGSGGASSASGSGNTDASGTNTGTSSGPIDTSTVQAPEQPKVDTSKEPVVVKNVTIPQAPVTIKPPVAPPTDETTTQTTTQNANTPATDPNNSPNTDPVTTVAPRAGGAVGTSEQRMPLKRDYRVSLGVFSSRAELRSQTAGVAALGYTVYPIAIDGGRFVAQVGPFDNADSANEAGRDIARVMPGATVRTPVNVAPAPVQTTPLQNSQRVSQAPTTTPPTDNTQPATTPPTNNDGEVVPATDPTPTPSTNTTNLDWQTTPGNSSTRQPVTPATPPETPTAPARTAPPATQPDTSNTPAAGATYLQVGAFAKAESANNMVRQLSALGYAASVQAPQGKNITVMIGPFQGAALARAESRLDNNGIEHFRVR